MPASQTSSAVREKDRGVEIAADLLRDGEDVFAGLDGDDLVHLRDTFPKVRELRRCQHAHVGVGPAAFDRAHGGHAHHRVAQPVARAEEDAEVGT